MKPVPLHAAASIFFACLLPPDAAGAAIRFGDFTSLAGLKLVGNASREAGVLRLTSAEHDQSGAAWFAEKQRIRSGFQTTFQFRLTRQGGFLRGADGFAFVLQNSGPTAIGGRGSAGGFGVAAPANPEHPGIPWSVAVFFDTCKNSEENDPSSNYVAIRTAGRPAELQWPADRLAFTPDLRIRLKDQFSSTENLTPS